MQRYIKEFYRPERRKIDISLGCINMLLDRFHTVLIRKTSRLYAELRLRNPPKKIQPIAPNTVDRISQPPSLTIQLNTFSTRMIPKRRSCIRGCPEATGVIKADGDVSGNEPTHNRLTFTKIRVMNISELPQQFSKLLRTRRRVFE